VVKYVHAPRHVSRTSGAPRYRSYPILKLMVNLYGVKLGGSIVGGQGEPFVHLAIPRR
jgi:hypothetical protein